jgi:hypothetical protein
MAFLAILKAAGTKSSFAASKVKHCSAPDLYGHQHGKDDSRIDTSVDSRDTAICLTTTNAAIFIVQFYNRCMRRLKSHENLLLKQPLPPSVVHHSLKP